MNVKELQRKCSDLYASSLATDKWNVRENELKDSIMNLDPEEFFSWQWTKITMFPKDTNGEHSFLRSLDDWYTRWRIIIESVDQREKKTVIRHCALIAWLEIVLSKNVVDFGSVLEFGGGYGSMRRLFYILGHRKNYLIYDLPLVAALQKSWLDDQRIYCRQFIELSSLKEYLDIDQSKDLVFIATWSLSESPVDLRDEFFDLVSGFQAMLFTYYPKVGNLDNEAYFLGKREELKQFEWHRKIVGRSAWLIGVRND